MKRHETLFAVSGRAILLACIIGVAAAALIASMALSHNPQQAFRGTDGIVWSALAPLCLIGFILGTGSTFTLYFAFNLVRSLIQRNGDGSD